MNSTLISLTACQYSYISDARLVRRPIDELRDRRCGIGSDSSYPIGMGQSAGMRTISQFAAC